MTHDPAHARGNILQQLDVRIGVSRLSRLHERCEALVVRLLVPHLPLGPFWHFSRA
jgi:hypothetical protein